MISFLTSMYIAPLTRYIVRMPVFCCCYFMFGVVNFMLNRMFPKWNNAFLIHFADFFLYSCFTLSPFPFFFSLLSPWEFFSFFPLCAFNLIYSLFSVLGWIFWMMHILFNCYKFNVDYVYRGCHKSQPKCTYSVTQFNDIFSVFFFSFYFLSSRFIRIQ